MTEDELAGWHHLLDRHEFELALGVDEGQGSLACYSPWGRKELDTTEQLNNNNFLLFPCCTQRGFPHGSDSKESACSAGDLGSIPVSKRSPGEGKGNSLQYSCLGNLKERRLEGYSP